MSDEVFERRLRRDLRRLADHLVDPRAVHPSAAPARSAGTPASAARPPSAATRRGRRPGGRLLVGAWGVAVASLVGTGVVAGQAMAGRATGGPAAAVLSALADTSGSAAFVSDGWLRTAEPGSAPRAVADVGDETSAPQWSADGDWIAYLGAGDLLHVVHPDGTEDRLAVAGPVTAMTWSPAADLLAVVPAGGAQQGDLLLVTVTGSGPAPPTVLASDVSSFVWSADGEHIAYSQAGGGEQPDRVAVADVVSGAVQELPYQAPTGDGILLAGWWPDGGGLLLWLDPGRSAAAEATGLELWSLPLQGTSALPLARTFVYLPWLAWSPDGDELALVEMPGAFPWQGSQLAVCTPSQGTCHPLAQPAGTVSLDPAWAPDGGEVAFVRAPVVPSGSPGAGLDAWYQQRRLWVSAPSGTAAHPVAGAPAGSAQPRFGPSGTTLTVVTGQAIDEVPVTGGRARPIASGLAGALDTAGPDGYGKLPWGGTVVWGP